MRGKVAITLEVFLYPDCHGGRKKVGEGKERERERDDFINSNYMYTYNLLKLLKNSSYWQ